MKPFFAAALLGLLGLGGSSHAADAGLPKRDLTVELRQIEEGREGGSSYSAGSADNTVWEPQMVQVRNGEKALLRMNDAIPMQWTQSASTQPANQGSGYSSGTPAQAAAAGAAGTGGTGNSYAGMQGGVTNALVWFDAGQSISVQPKWQGGHQAAVLEVEVQRAAVDQRMGADLPKQTRNTVSTTITAPLAEWVTIAATGRAPRAGSYSSESGLQVRRLLQIRVMVP